MWWHFESLRTRFQTILASVISELSYGDLAQLVERLFGLEQVRRSIRLVSTTFLGCCVVCCGHPGNRVIRLLSSVDRASSYGLEGREFESLRGHGDSIH